jgi:hypothetical protein
VWTLDRSFLTHQEAEDTVIEYIEMIYNNHRRHSTAGYLSPNAFEVQPKVVLEEREREKEGIPEYGSRGDL